MSSQTFRILGAWAFFLLIRAVLVYGQEGEYLALDPEPHDGSTLIGRTSENETDLVYLTRRYIYPNLYNDGDVPTGPPTRRPNFKWPGNRIIWCPAASVTGADLATLQGDLRAAWNLLDCGRCTDPLLCFPTRDPNRLYRS